MDVGVSEGPQGKREYSDLGHSLCDCCAACWGGGSGGVGFGEGEESGGEGNGEREGCDGGKGERA